MKILVFFIVGILLSSSIVAFGLTREEHLQMQSLSLSFNEPTLVDDGVTLHVVMNGAPACVYQPGQPVLPMYTTTLQLPFGSTIRNVTIRCDEVKKMMLQKKITPAPYPVSQGISSDQSEVGSMTEAYNTQEFYPLQWVAYSTGSGLDKDSNHVTFFTLRVFPARYCQASDTILYLGSCDITITYEPLAQSPFPSAVINDLIIICPLQFVLPLQRLAEHKNMIGVRTRIIPLAQIYRNYLGYDRPEQIKYFIKDAVESWGTHYVLLVGGLKSHLIGKPRDNINTGTRDWHLPVRYTNLWDDDTVYDPGFISDLYYADIYDGQGSFCNWNSFDDGVYGGWTHAEKSGPPNYPPDEIDFYPDIYLGRLPCRNIIEVHTIVKKIIAYETNPAEQSWFNKMVVVGGDPYDDQATNYREGEIIGEKALSYMSGFEQCKLFSSNRDTNPDFTPETQNIIREINEGCGFLFFDGHGGPSWWNTFWPGEFDTLIQNGGISVYQFSRLKNNEKLPICIVGGCHNNLFNVSFLSTITDPRNKHFMWSNGLPILACWGWSLTVKLNGGAIATIGNTGLGYEAGGEVGDLDGNGMNEPDCVESLCGYLETQFFKGYQVDHIGILGKNWCQAITDYLKIYPGMEKWSDAKTLEQWVLLGDPSLKIGGYSS
ncbi:MAG TPA: C25 family cysteine peptidase [Candidatus Thermoplasmatota archaeon]|nr:C25 family cysteine peptidase [Candidatus Thermoplasmatota archaeon]